MGAGRHVCCRCRASRACLQQDTRRAGDSTPRGASPPFRSRAWARRARLIGGASLRWFVEWQLQLHSVHMETVRGGVLPGAHLVDSTKRHRLPADVFMASDCDGQRSEVALKGCERRGRWRGRWPRRRGQCIRRGGIIGSVAPSPATERCSRNDGKEH